MAKKEMIAMLLAGGQGTRLGVLTKKIAKPAIPFGGKYRIIDFPLSNCTNSGIDTVGVLTQYQPFILNNHIGIGTPWNLDRKNGGVSLLPAHQNDKGAKWYKGTANAIYQNLDFVNNYDPEYVLILSGDHIYKMDYNEMLNFHKEKKADATIAVISVSLEEASRFGIMNADENDKIYEFEEKPKKPKSTLASMGIYIFKWKKLKEYLVKDEKNPDSKNDFGANIIPMMIKDENNIYAYKFNGYWKDVGTIESFWGANMDLLDSENELDIFNKDWRIYSVNPIRPPQYIGKNSSIKNSLIVEGCTVLGTVENSILFPGVTIGENTIIRDCVIMENSKINNNCIVNNSILGENVVVYDNVSIGNSQKITVIGQGNRVSEGNDV